MKYIRPMYTFRHKAPLVSIYQIAGHPPQGTTLDLLGGARWGWSNTPKFNLRKREVKS